MRVPGLASLPEWSQGWLTKVSLRFGGMTTLKNQGLCPGKNTDFSFIFILILSLSLFLSFTLLRLFCISFTFSSLPHLRRALISNQQPNKMEDYNDEPMLISSSSSSSSSSDSDSDPVFVGMPVDVDGTAMLMIMMRMYGCMNVWRLMVDGVCGWEGWWWRGEMTIFCDPQINNNLLTIFRWRREWWGYHSESGETKAEAWV